MWQKIIFNNFAFTKKCVAKSWVKRGGKVWKKNSKMLFYGLYLSSNISRPKMQVSLSKTDFKGICMYKKSVAEIWARCVGRDLETKIKECLSTVYI